MTNTCFRGYTIKKFREINGYSIDELAKMLGFTPRYVYDIESGNKGMTLETFEKISIILNISADYLLWNKNSRYSEEQLHILSITENIPKEKITLLISILENSLLLVK